MTCAVYFNLDDTMTEMSRDYEDIYREAVEAAGFDELADKYEEYTDLFFKYFQDSWAFPRRQAMDKLSHKYDCYDGDSVEQFAEAWEEAEADSVTLRDGVKDALDQLSGTYQLGILSNGTGKLQRRKLEKMGIEDYFDSIIISSEQGTSKPEKAIFEIARSALKADTHVMVSHIPKRDIIAARKHGFEAIWLSDTDREVSENVALTFSDYSELPDRIAELCE